MEDAPTPNAKIIGQQIAGAIDTAPDELLPGKTAKIKRRRVALALGISDDTLERYISGKGDASALNVWRISQMTGRSFGWFADAHMSPEERLAVVAELAASQVEALESMLHDLIHALADARAGVGRLGDSELGSGGGAAERGLGRASASRRRQSAEEISEPVASSSEAAG